MASADVLPVSILHVAGPHKIAVRVDDDSGRVKEKFYHLQRKLQCLAYEERLRPLQALEGLCIAKRGASYYRGQVLSSLAAEQVAHQQTNKQTRTKTAVSECPGEIGGHWGRGAVPT